MEISIFNKTGTNLKEIRYMLKKLFSKISDDATFQIIIIDNDKIREMNRNYRGKDYPTDVLSFEDSSLESLGDVFISLEKAEEQAREFEHSLNREVGYLAIHGYLHLKGYNHENKEEKELMRIEEEKILCLAKLWRTYENYK